MQICLFKSQYLISECQEVKSCIRTVERTWPSSKSNELSWDLDGLVWSSMIQKEDTSKDVIPCTGKSRKLFVNQKFMKRTITFCFSTSWQECCEYDDFVKYWFLLRPSVSWVLCSCNGQIVTSVRAMHGSPIFLGKDVHLTYLCVCVCVRVRTHVSCDIRGIGNVAG